MPLFWRIRSWFGHWVGKIIGLIFLIILVLGVIFLVRNFQAILKTLDDLMTF